MPRPPASPLLFSISAFQFSAVSAFAFSLLPSSFPRRGEACRAGQTRTARSSAALPVQWVLSGFARSGDSPLPHALKRDQIQSVRARGRGALLAADGASGPHPPLSRGRNVSASRRHYFQLPWARMLVLRSRPPPLPLLLPPPRPRSRPRSLPATASQ